MTDTVGPDGESRSCVHYRVRRSYLRACATALLVVAPTVLGVALVNSPARGAGSTTPTLNGCPLLMGDHMPGGVAQLPTTPVESDAAAEGGCIVDISVLPAYIPLAQMEPVEVGSDPGLIRTVGEPSSATTGTVVNLEVAVAQEANPHEAVYVSGNGLTAGELVGLMASDLALPSTAQELATDVGGSAGPLDDWTGCDGQACAGQPGYGPAWLGDGISNATEAAGDYTWPVNQIWDDAPGRVWIEQHANDTGWNRCYNPLTAEGIGVPSDKQDPGAIEVTDNGSSC